jgi:hypothetical protein
MPIGSGIALQQRFWLATLNCRLSTLNFFSATQTRSQNTSHDSQPHLCTRIAFGGGTRANASFCGRGIADLSPRDNSCCTNVVNASI